MDFSLISQNIDDNQLVDYGDVSLQTSHSSPMVDMFIHKRREVTFFPQSSSAVEASLRRQEIDAALKKIDKPTDIPIDIPIIGPSIQEGSGIMELGAAALKGAAGAAAAFATAQAAVKAVGVVGSKIGEVAKGPIGTNISNFLSEKFNKNPAWRPGFPGEAHLVLPTEFGLTRANYAGPGTNLSARLDRGDTGVDGPKGIDEASKVHDILYSIARTPKDIRSADNILISDIDRGSQGPKTKAMAIRMLKAKKFGEDVGVFGPETFTSLPKLRGSGDLTNCYPDHGMSGMGEKTAKPAKPKKHVLVVKKLLPADTLRKNLLQQLKKSGFTGRGLQTDMRGTSFDSKGHSVGIQPGQRGGQLGFLATLAANLIIPAIIKAVRKKKKKKQKR